RLLAMLGLLKLFVPPILFPETGANFSASLDMPLALTGPGITVSAASGSAVLSLEAVLLLVWAAMAGGILLYTGIRVLSLAYIKRYSREIPWPGDLVQAGNVDLSQSPFISSPIVFGLMTKHILVPEYWPTLSDASKTSILHHELAHLRQKDHWIVIPQILAFILNFFNPLVWVLNKTLNRYTELTCDEKALSDSLLKPKHYMSSLVEVAEMSTFSRLLTPAPAFSESYRNLRARINYQFERSDGMISRITSRHILILVFMGLFIIPLSCDVISKNKQPTPASTESQATPESSMGLSGPKMVPYDKPPQLIGGIRSLQEAIQYPEVAKQAGVEGTVIVRTFIDKTGTVGEIKVIKGVPKTGLNDAAVEAVRQTRWTPATQNGTPVGIWYSIPIAFRLDSSPGASDNSQAPQTPPLPDDEGAQKPVPFDQPPELIGGFASVREHLNYPESAKEQGIQGTVILQIYITKQGKVTRAKITRGATDALNEAAIQALMKTEWKPAILYGDPVDVWYSVPIVFRLQNDQK
ncbi:MAG TPA: M56 family metallopeptidase, partial [bacterium]|nr:M56 family metallopeptidase [bacterium]